MGQIADPRVLDEMSIGYDAVEASFFGLPSIATRNGYEISLANFTVKSGENRLSRTKGVVAGGVVQSGSLKFGKTVASNPTFDTVTGKYVSGNFSL